MTKEIKMEMENHELRAEIRKLGNLLSGYKSLMEYWKRRCVESDKYIDEIFELFEVKKDDK